jgi:hypothetical protein
MMEGLNWKAILLIAALGTSGGGLAGTAMGGAVHEARIDEVEKKVTKVQAKADAMAEALARIDERTKIILEELQK